jgi:hypothetical protein
MLLAFLEGVMNCGVGFTTLADFLSLNKTRSLARSVENALESSEVPYVHEVDKNSFFLV